MLQIPLVSKCKSYCNEKIPMKEFNKGSIALKYGRHTPSVVQQRFYLLTLFLSAKSCTCLRLAFGRTVQHIVLISYRCCRTLCGYRSPRIPLARQRILLTPIPLRLCTARSLARFKRCFMEPVRLLLKKYLDFSKRYP